jgi:RimJ/RimL family protein N-acetyltransferase
MHKHEADIPSQPIEIQIDDELSLVQLTEKDAVELKKLIDTNADYLEKFFAGTKAYFDSLEKVVKSITEPDNEHRIQLGIRTPDGLVGVVNIEPYPDNSADFGYWVGEQFGGRAYATRAANTAIAYVFKNTSIDTLTAQADNQNKPSMRILEGSGFKTEITTDKTTSYELTKADFESHGTGDIAA